MERAISGYAISVIQGRNGNKERAYYKMTCGFVLHENCFLFVRYPLVPQYSPDELEVMLCVNHKEYCIFKDSLYYVFQAEIPALLTHIQASPTIVVDKDEIRVLLDEMSSHLCHFLLFHNKNFVTTLVNSSVQSLLRMDLWQRNEETWNYTLLYSFHVDRMRFFDWISDVTQNAKKRFEQANFWSNAIVENTN